MPTDSHDPATSGPRYRATTGGHGNAEPHDEPWRVWTAADVAEFNAGVRRAKADYYGPDNTASALAKAGRKAEAQQRYRESKKGKS